MGTMGTPVGRNTNAFVPDLVDQEPFVYWDAGTLLAAQGTQVSGTYYCFKIPNGTPNPALTGGIANTKLQTNMTQPAQFAPPRCLLLQSICFQYSSRMLKSDIDLIEDGAYFEFKISDKTFFEGYIRDAPAGAGLMGVTTNNGESVYTNGFPTPAATRRFGSWAKYIPPQVSFSLNVFFNGSNNIVGGVATPPTMTGPNGMIMRVLLDGITALPVQ